MYKRVFCLFLSLCLMLSISLSAFADDPGFSDYTLPEGYSLTDITDTSCSLVKDGEVVGGFAITDLDVESLDNWNDETIFPPELIAYLEKDLPDTVYDEYMIDSWHPYTTVIYILTDSETNERREYIHFFFERDGQVWDLWTDRDVLGSEAEDIPEEMGIAASETATTNS